MDDACRNYSADDSEDEKEHINPSEQLLDSNVEYQPFYELIQGPDKKAIGEKFEIKRKCLKETEHMKRYNEDGSNPIRRKAMYLNEEAITNESREFISTLCFPVGKGNLRDVRIGILSSALLTAKIPVAVKKAQMETGSVSAEEREDIVRRQRQALRDELSILTHLQSSSTGGHENVLKLLGAITTDRTGFYLLTEYCERGSMDRFLQEKWKNGLFENELVFKGDEMEQVWKIQRDSNWGKNYRSRRENGTIATSDLMWFALQIARAMQFLANMNVIHQDIGLRNVLVKSDFALKVGNFGLSRKLEGNDDEYENDYKNDNIPIQYVPLESLTSGCVMITSEIWSYGVVVWELFTFAENRPYFTEFGSCENKLELYRLLVEYLSSGQRLSIPITVPEEIKSLLSRLWHPDPKQRPSFQECRKIIRQELMQSCPNIDQNSTYETKYSEYSIDHGEKEEECVSPKEKLLFDNDEYQKDDALIRERLDYKAIDEKFEIEPDTLTIVKVIGKGYFSDVHMGILSLPTICIFVAVKMPQMKTGAMNVVESEDIVRRQRQALRDELKIFAHLQSSSAGGHENVLKLLVAITTISTDFCLLTEYCECGSMDRFLQEKWKNGLFENELVFEIQEKEKIWKIQHDSNWGKNYQSRRENGTITTSDLLWFALQIARAMQFLANMNVVHRDIALRNVLLRTDFNVKVADFGLSRKLHGRDEAYYIKNQETVLPIRYVAPESLRSGRFAVTSDIWSFGVVVWELFTFAENRPYFTEFGSCESKLQFYGFLLEHLSSGFRLSNPNNAPQQIKSLLSRLWHSDPKQRPSFQECRKIIRQELMQSCPNMLLKEEAPHHASAYSLLRLDAEEVNERTSESLNSTPLESGTSAQPSRENQQPVNHEVRVRRKVDRRIVVSVGFLALVLVAMLTALGFILLYALLLESKNVTSSSDSTFAEVANALQNTNTAIWYRKAAEQGNVAAQLNLGLMYEQGSGVPQSDEEAVEWYRKAAENGNAIAQSNLGNMYRNGRGVTQSNEKAEKWLRKAAERGHASAQYNLGVIYSSGQSVSYSDEEAVKWFRMAAEQGVAGAQNSLGIMYQNGRGVPKSDEEAVEWYNKAAERGYANAQNILGVMYCRGQGVNQSYEDAVKWFRKAAEQGDINSQYNLGIMYSKGQGVLPSNVDAAYWFSKAKEQGKAEIQHNVRLIHDEA